jgi:ABC-type transporter Mla MlaB component
MTDKLTISKTSGDVVVLHLGGKLDGQTKEALLAAAQAEHKAGVRFLLIDLENLEMITSAGLGALHNIFKLFTPEEDIEAWDKEKHGEPYKSDYFKLAAAPPSVYYVLNIAGFLNNIPIYPDVPAALAAFAK